MNSTWHPHRLAVAIAVLLALAAACGGDEPGSSDAASALYTTAADASTEDGDGGGACAVDEAAVEDLFDVDVSRYPETVPGVPRCGFGVDGKPGFGFNVTSLGEDVPPYGSYAAAVEQMETESASFEGTRLVPVNAGDEAVARASAGHAELLTRNGDDVMVVTALLPSDHPLAQADDDLLTTTTELAKLAL